MARKNETLEHASTDAAEGAIANKENEGLSQGQIVRRRFVRHRAAMISVFVLSTLVTFVFSALDFKLGFLKWSGWWDFSYKDLSPLADCPGGTVGCPSLDVFPAAIDGDGFGFRPHPFGQDDIGRDYFSLVMRGTQRSLTVMVIIGTLATTLGTIIGSIAGYYRGRVDGFIMRFYDFFITIPTIIVAAVIGFRYGALGAVPLAIMLGLFGWVGPVRLVRAEFFTLREREFVDAARVAGASNRRIIFKHILPNVTGIIVVLGTLSLSGAILLETGLSYLGFGVVSPDVSLGLIINTYQDAFNTRPWLFWYPGLFIITIALSINFIGDGLRDAFDPRQKRRITKKDREAAKAAKAAASVSAGN
jgi:ABC-type dipeptide/oligopeptide/nickel transport system permease subunit